MPRQLPPLAAIVTLALALSLSTVTAGAAKLATPPTAKELVGVWIGFDRDQLTFSRLKLNQDSTGFLARVSPADTILHVSGVHVYRITKWRVDGWNIEIIVSPASNATSVGYIKGRIGLASMRLRIGGPENGGWKEEPLLYRGVATNNFQSRDERQDRRSREKRRAPMRGSLMTMV